MTLDRRQVLAGGSVFVASCASGVAPRAADKAAPLDALLAAHADVLPEAAGAGANHYPMAAEVLETLGHAESIESAWSAGAASYAGAIPRSSARFDADEALGDYERYGDWLELFRAELAREPWRAVVARWTPRLAPGVSAAVFHGLIRTAHAVRALRRRDTRERRGELGIALAYWAARYDELRSDGAVAELRTPLARLAHPWIDDVEDVPFDDVHVRLARAPIAPRVTLEAYESASANALLELEALVREAAEAFLEMLVLERHRIWLLHTVTGPAAAALLVPELDARGARALAAYSRQTVVALFVAFGAPFVPRAHVRTQTAPWPELIERAAASRSVHTLKLVEALARFRHIDDPLCRSVAAQWFEWT
jgi:hypothetical protein